MNVVDNTLVFAATDLSNYLACGHLSLLDRRTALGGPRPRRFDDPSVEVLRQRGFEHERAVLERLGPGVVEIEGPDTLSGTIEAMRSGALVIYQGALRRGDWYGRPDFLIKVDRPSDLGDWSYEVVDAKLAREAKGGALLQLLVYADLLEHVQGNAPEHVHLELGGPEGKRVTFLTAEYAAYFRSLRLRFVEHVSSAPETLPFAPDPVEHCSICAWQYQCDKERREVDHLSLVAGITRTQRRALERMGIETVAGLSELDLSESPNLDGVSRSALERIREQARIQVEGRREGKHKYELLLPVVPGEGLAALPPPSPGDIFLDLEGDPYALTYGIEYLLGYVDGDGRYVARRALDRGSEKRAFEELIDFVTARLAVYPDLHIYHYAPYEPTAFKRLMGRHATREEEVDRLLRGEVFVDLYRVVKQAMRASVESYSIKKMEPFYGFERAVDLRTAASALAHFEAWLELGENERHDDGLLEQIERYNRDDCLSTLRLRDWLESRRLELAERVGADVPRPEPGDPEPTESLAQSEAEVAMLAAALTADVPADPDHRTPEQQARWLLAQLLGFHRREMKSAWWEYFRYLGLSDDELIDDNATLGGFEYVGVVGRVKRSHVHRYRFPHQEHGFRVESENRDPATEKSAGVIVDVDDGAGTIDLKRSVNSDAPHPRALIPFDIVRDDVLRESLRRIARAVLDSGLGETAAFRAAADLLLRLSPRVGQQLDEELQHPDETELDAARRLIGRLDRTILPIQGPPGAGKTYTGARMIVEALKSGKSVGVTGPSHKVISNLLDSACKAAKEAGLAVQGIQKTDGSQESASKCISATESNAKVLAALKNGEAQMAGGTAWLWARDDMIGAVDLLFIDEAGQFSLANALAVAPAAGSLVLLGDPKQLDQPTQGVHPPGTDTSALGHLLGEESTMPSDRGLFLEHTWRLHPALCDFTSEIFYAGRLASQPGLEIQRVTGPPPLNGAGLRFIAVDHEGNVNESPEEVEVVAKLIDDLLAAGSTWTDEHGKERVLGLQDILVVAPYNAHVAALSERLASGARVGTVDKFQGQQGPIVIYSMATSTAEDAPRGMKFLFSSNRLNVATSRARALAVLVANPSLLQPECRTPEQMRLANAFCRLEEIAAAN